MGTKGNASEYAKHRGVSAALITKAVKIGRIKPWGYKGKRAVFDFDQCDADWDKNRDPSNRGYDTAKVIEVTEVIGPNDRSVDGQTAGDEPEMSFNQARTLRERYQAQLARLEYEEKSGKLVDSETIRRQYFKQARNARDNLLNIPDRLAPMLAGRTELHEIRMLILEELHKVCEGLAE